MILLACLAAAWAQTTTWSGADRREVPADVAARFAPQPRWQTPLSGVAHASPVELADVVVVTDAPTDLVAFDRETGVERWRRPHSQALAATDRVATGAGPAQVDALRHALSEARHHYSALLRAQRRADAAATAHDLEAAGDAVRAAAAALAAAETGVEAATGDLVGWASPSPVTDGATVYAVFANGVVSAPAPDGATRWMRWLGPFTQQLRGYAGGRPTASPVLADGVLVVPYDHLVGLDPATGRTLWTGPAYPHYGSPVVGVVGGRAVVATPAVELVDARTGEVIAAADAEIRYSGPWWEGDRIFVAGSDARSDGEVPNHVRAYDVRASGSGATLTQRWSTHVVFGDRIYATPIVVGDDLIVTTKERRLLRLDPDTGEVRSELRVGEHGEWWAPVLASGGDVVTVGTDGTAVRVDPVASTVTVLGDLPPARSTPLIVGGDLFWRGEEALVRVEVR